MRKISPNVPKLCLHVRGKKLNKDQKKVQKRQKKIFTCGKKSLKKTKKRSKWIEKNATIQIVAGHSEQNEPLFICLSREYSFCLGREYSLVRKRHTPSERTGAKLDNMTKTQATTLQITPVHILVEGNQSWSENSMSNWPCQQKNADQRTRMAEMWKQKNRNTNARKLMISNSGT